jgi:hypothetical protein
MRVEIAEAASRSNQAAQREARLFEKSWDDVAPDEARGARDGHDALLFRRAHPALLSALDFVAKRAIVALVRLRLRFINLT